MGKNGWEFPDNVPAPEPGNNPAPTKREIPPSYPAAARLPEAYHAPAEDNYDYNNGGNYDTEDLDDEVRESHTARRVGLAVIIGAVMVTGALGTKNLISSSNTQAGLTLQQQKEQFGVHTPTEVSDETEPTEAPTTTTAKPTASQTVTAKETAKPPVAVVPAVEACVDATPVSLKLAQQTMLPLSSNSNIAEIMALQKKTPTNWTVMDNVNVDVLQKVQNVYPGIRARLATNNEGGAATWFKGPNGAALPSLADVEAGKVSAAELSQLLAANLANLRSNGIFMNLAPVVDVAPKAGQEKGRMFSNEKAAEAYLATYLKVANQLGVYATLKHFPNGLSTGNTNTQTGVKTAAYTDLEKSGLLKPYAALSTKDNKNWVMMSGATTTGWPDTKLDNKKQNIFNPAAYAALNKLTGGAPVITDAIGPSVKGLNAMPVDKAAIEALKAGTNIVLISSPDNGKTITQQVEANEKTINAALKSGELDPKKFDESYLKVLGNKGLTACGVLKAFDAKAYAGLTKPQPTTTATSKPTATAKVPATGTPTPSKTVVTTEKPKTAVAQTTSIKATSTSSQKIVVKSTAVATAGTK